MLNNTNKFGTDDNTVLVFFAMQDIFILPGKLTMIIRIL